MDECAPTAEIAEENDINAREVFSVPKTAHQFRPQLNMTAKMTKHIREDTW